MLLDSRSYLPAKDSKTESCIFLDSKGRERDEKREKERDWLASERC